MTTGAASADSVINKRINSERFTHGPAVLLRDSRKFAYFSNAPRSHFCARKMNNDNRSDDDRSFSLVDMTDKTPILRNPRRKCNRLQSKSCIATFLGLVTVISILLYNLVVFTRNAVDDDESLDPEFPSPPSTMPMGSYRKIGVVSNGLPCAQIGVDVLTRGGNAVDAAIATMLCDGVLCPEYMGLGGGFIMSIYNATTKKVMSINARETAPAAATESMFVKSPTESIYGTGGLAVAVPGSLKGYSAIYKAFGGGVSWESLFEPTIKLCEEGMEISEHLWSVLNGIKELIKNDTILRKSFFDEKTRHVKKAGEIYKFPELAKTMRIIAKEGADAIYNGSLTSQLVEDLKKVNSIITKEDFANYEVDIEESFSVNLKSGHTIHAGSPPGAGIILAFILRILDGMLPAPDAGLDAHRIVEAFKFAYGERSHLGDYRFVNVSKIYNKVKSDSYINMIRSKISDNFTSLDPKYYGADFYLLEDHGTANMVVTDSTGNVVVGTSTVNTYFGCGLTSPSTGIILNNEMDDFSTPGVINYFGFPPSPSNFIKPGKRPMSSMCPSVFTDSNGDFVLGVGAAGGSKITLATAYVSAFKLWYNKSLKESIDKPRIYHQLMPMVVEYEYGITKDVIQKLKDIGHPVKRMNKSIGSAVTAIAKSSAGMIETMPDFRRPGNSSGY